MDIDSDELPGQSGICVRGLVDGGHGQLVVRSGHSLRGLAAVEVLVADDAGPRWAPIAQLELGDYVAIRYGGAKWGGVYRIGPMYRCVRCRREGRARRCKRLHRSRRGYFEVTSTHSSSR